MKPAVKLLLMFSGAIAPPPAVTNLAITGASGGTVADLTPEATWDSAAGAVTYTLQYGTASDFTGATEVTGIATTSYTIPSALDNFTTYYFRVAGVNSAGQGPWSDSVSVQTSDLVTAILALSPVGFWYAGDGVNTPAAMNGATDGGAVTTWSDLGSESNDVAQSTPSARPTYDLSNAVFNNRGCVTFVGANSQYLSKNLSASVVSEDTTYNIIAVVAGSPSTQLFSVIWSEGNSATNAYLRLGFGNPTSEVIGWHTSAVLMNGGSSAADDTAKLVTMRKITTNSYTLRLNGAQITTNANNANAAMDRLAIGANLRASAALHLTGSIAFVAAFTTDAYSTAEALIASHYGITLP